MNFIDVCRQIVAIDSTPGNGTVEVADFVGRWGQELGFHVEFQDESLNGVPQRNVVLSHPKSPQGDGLLLLSHLDTPDPGNYAMWTKTMANPFKASVYGDEIFGLGVAGAKLDLLTKILAAKTLLDKAIKRPFIVAGSFGEQLGMVGAFKLVRRGRHRPKYAVVGDPTQSKLVNGGAGLATVEVTIPFSMQERAYIRDHNAREGVSSQSKIFSGKPSIGNNPQLSENAIIKMFDHLENLPEGIVVMEMDGGVSANTVPSSAFLEIDLVGGFENSVIKKIAAIRSCLLQLEADFANYPEPGFSPDTSTLNIGQVRTSAEGIKFYGSCRILPSVSEAVAQEWLDRLRRVCRDVGAGFDLVSNLPPFVTATNASVADLCRRSLSKLGQNADFRKSTVCTEASVLSRLGVECIVFGPGEGPGNTHQPNEKVSLSELNASQAFYSELLSLHCL